MTQTTPPPSDDDLPDERELAALYARLPKVEPDASLDAAVLAAAARATPMRRRPRWPVAMASAAVLVLAVGVAWQVRELQPAPSSLPTAAAPRDEKSIAAGAAPTTKKHELRRSVVGAAPAAMPTPRAQAHRAATPTMVPQVIRPVLPLRAPAPAPVAAAPPAPAAPPEPPSPPSASEARDAVMSAAPAPSPQQYEKAAPARSGILLQKLAPNGLGPDDRVGEIRRLLSSGDRTQAIRELQDLRRRYPHYDLPQDLRDLTP